MTNVLLHAVTAILLFLVLRSMTGRLWPSAFVAMIFAIHPLRVESVAWISERKDVLSGLFFMLTLGAYAAYARRKLSVLRYAAVTVLLVLGLMSKPMLVTLPCVLLLLDYWPLGRMTAEPGQTSRRFLLGRVLIEKLPLFLLVAVSCVVTEWAQRGAIISVDVVPVSVRIGNTLVSYVAYVGQMFYPANLAVFYPHPHVALPLWKVIAAAVLLTGVSAAAVLARRGLPYLFVGWFWYLGMLVPVIGLVQVGAHAMADRYTYLPQIGLYIAVAWAVADGICRVPWLRPACQVASAAVVFLLIVCAWQQTTYWRDSVTLWTHALSCTRDNVLAHNNLGQALGRRGDVNAAIDQYNAALAMQPTSHLAHNNLGTIFAHRGEIDKAGEQFEEAIKSAPDYVEAHNNLGNILARRGKTADAIAQYRIALDLNPEWADAYNNLACALFGIGDIEGAVQNYRAALRINRWYVDAHKNLSFALRQQGKIAESLDELRAVVRLQPDRTDMLSQLAWMLATYPDASIRNGHEAVALAEQAVRQSRSQDPAALKALAAAYAEVGRFSEAVQVGREAAHFALQQNQSAVADAAEADIALYKKKVPFRQPAALTAPVPPRNRIPSPLDADRIPSPSDIGRGWRSSAPKTRHDFVPGRMPAP